MTTLVVTLILVVFFYLLGLLSLKADDWSKLPTRYHVNVTLACWGLSVVIGIVGFVMHLASISN